MWNLGGRIWRGAAPGKATVFYYQPSRKSINMKTKQIELLHILLSTEDNEGDILLTKEAFEGM